MSRSHVPSLAVAAGVALVLATHVFVDIDLLRFKIVQSPVAAVDGEVHASSSGSAVNALKPPFALIGRIHNPSNAPASFTIAIDGTVVCTARIPAARTRRFDCAIARAWSRADEHAITIVRQQSAWELEYLELATHHGGTAGERGLVVLPAGSTIDTRLPAVWVVLASIAVFALLVLPRRPSWPWLAWHVYRIVAGFIVVYCLLIQASQWFSSYRVVLAATSFFFWLAVVLSPWILSALRWMLLRTAAPADRLHRVVRAAFAGTVVLLAFGALVHAKLADSYRRQLQRVPVRVRARLPRQPVADDARRCAPHARAGPRRRLRRAVHVPSPHSIPGSGRCDAHPSGTGQSWMRPHTGTAESGTSC